MDSKMQTKCNANGMQLHPCTVMEISSLQRSVIFHDPKTKIFG
nr:MAG TPA_asm: hypothetical protein [Caudoviricetes sp.]